MVATGLSRAGYDEVDAHIIGDHLRVTARSQPQILRATLSRTAQPPLTGGSGARGSNEPEPAIDVASGTVRSGTTIVFASGESLDVTRGPLPLDKLPGAVEERLLAAGYSGVQVAVDPAANTVHATGRSDVDLVASLGSLPSVPLGRGGELGVAGSSVVTLSKGVPIFLGGEACPLQALPALVTKKLGKMGYVEVKAKLQGDSLRVNGRSPVALTASIHGLPQVGPPPSSARMPTAP